MLNKYHTCTQLPDPLQVVIIVYFRLFESKPELLELFAHFREHGLHEIKKNGLLRQHALRVMATVDKSITRIDEPDAFIEMLRDVGHAHKQYNVPSQNIQVTIYLIIIIPYPCV